MENLPFTIRYIRPGDLFDCMQLSTAEHWNQTETDWRFFIENPKNICLAAQADGKVIATTVAVNYSNEIAWISMVLVNNNYRNKGISKLLLQTILEKLPASSSVKLDATAAGHPVYKKFGFADEYLITRMTNTAVKHLHGENDVITAEPVQAKDIDEIAAFDQTAFGANRKQLIEFLIKENTGVALQLKHGKQLTAFVLGRDGCNYQHIGPLMASAFSDAKSLIIKALNKLQHKPVVVDVPNDKIELINWLTSIGFIKQRHFLRMYKKGNQFPGHISKQYLICGPEFG